MKAVLFDWDGTLADTADASYRCYVDLFASYGIPFDRASFQRAYSPNWRLTYSGLGLPEEKWGEADARWLARYGQEKVALLPEALESVRRLRDAGLRLGLVTTGNHQRVTREMADLEMAPFFEAVVCGEDIRRHKPDPEGLLLALERLHLAAGEAAYVGDSPEDVEMARAAGVFAVGVPGGFPNREALAASRPDLLAGSLRDAVDALAAR